MLQCIPTHMSREFTIFRRREPAFRGDDAFRCSNKAQMQCMSLNPKLRSSSGRKELRLLKNAGSKLYN